MRFMILVKATDESEAGAMPSEEMLAAMTSFNQEMVEAGVMLAGEGLHPSSKGARVRIGGGATTVTDGPFTETKELLAGFWIIEAASLAEAIDWAKRCPADPNASSELEIRQVFEADDFGEAMTPELREAEERMRTRMAGRE